MPPLNIEVTIPLKYLSTIGLPLINFEVEPDLLLTKICVLAENDTNLNDAAFQINSIKHYVLLVTLSINDNIKFLENLKQVFKRTISWNKYRSETTVQPKVTIWIL